MNYLECKIDFQRKWVREQKKNIRKWLMIGVIYPVLIAWCVGDIYYHPLHWIKSFSLGVNVTSFFWYIVIMLEAIGDYRSDKRILEFYEKHSIGNE